MPLETKIEQLTQAVIALTQVIQSQAAHVTPASPATQAQPAPVAAAPAAPAVQAPQAPVAAAPVMPALPTFQAAPVAAPAAPAAPFADVQGMIQYVMSAYQSMGPEKGSKIQGVLSQLGYANINDVKPEHFGHLYQGVEALKAS